MKTAEIAYRDNIAYSDEFDDIYFNTQKPWAESEYVFASAIDDIWHKQDSFIVAEIGFGAGLNFLTLYNKFKKSSKKLHYVSIEAYPIKPDDLSEIYKKLGVFKSLSKKLIKYYPPLTTGIHRIEFQDNITLDICFGDANEMIDELDFKADVWFMDGFAPKKNPNSWSEEIFLGISRLTKVGGVVRTYSCAKIVRENFAKFGFSLELKDGYGKKRQMSHAVLNQESFNVKNLWFLRSRSDENLKDVLIVGAGIAGILSAYELKKLGFNVTLVDKEPDIATNGSSNHSGILMPLVTKPLVPLGKMHKNAFLLASRFYKTHMSKGLVEFNGCFDYAYDILLLERYKKAALADPHIFKFSSTKPYASIFHNLSATAHPKNICKKLNKDINAILNLEYISHKHLKSGKISVKFKDKTTIKTDILIFCLGSHSRDIFKHLPLSSVRGQVTHIKPIIDLKSPISALGYITPPYKNIQVVGATYGRNEIDDSLRDSDNVLNLEKVSEFINPKNAKIIGANVGYRSYSSDRFPIISALHDEEAYKKSYHNLFWTKHKQTQALPTYHKNVYLNIAHGSRGLCTAVLGAKLLADMILNRPLCIEKSLFNELHSARFLIRNLKKSSFSGIKKR